MANLYGKLWGNRGVTTRTGSSDIHAKLETWEGSVMVRLTRGGKVTVYTGDKSYPSKIVWEGTIDSSGVDND